MAWPNWNWFNIVNKTTQNAENSSSSTDDWMYASAHTRTKTCTFRGEHPQACRVAFGSPGPHTAWLGHLGGKLVDKHKISNLTESK